MREKKVREEEHDHSAPLKHVVLAYLQQTFKGGEICLRSVNSHAHFGCRVLYSSLEAPKFIMIYCDIIIM